MSTLNSCFGPAYDFLTARSDEFCLEPELWLVKHYISRFCSIYVDKYEDLAPHLWKVIGDEIVPAQCRIYSYRPDHLSDPYSSGCLASFNYFFHNRCLRRVLFFSLRVLNDSLVDDDEDELTESNLY
ncbi:RNA polymerase III-inhibiting protein maf1 [Schistosoma haematobium]|uniref:Repressor of RNA polymerase III transcription MAF1 homolog n=2 Tax=Schistosoma haematobium TaxID=6185 RepID=A0A922RZW1_SCHHA|nr:RNA polymerase III-inhibiting protein maf1 [Schistosoma haematobium]KAH9587543.1 RNA polymerase III-inhibiting protein maf1 [Schistosoma haematobium]